MIKMLNMIKKVTATQAKRQFGALLEDALSAGRVEITKHGRVIAVLLPARDVPAVGWVPAGFALAKGADGSRPLEAAERRNREVHAIAPSLARAAREIRKSR